MPSAGGRRTEYRGPVLRDVIQLVLYALLAAFSPLAFAATMTVIQAERQAIGFQSALSPHSSSRAHFC